MSGDVCIRAWPGSYYWEPEKRWVPGTLGLTPCVLSFTANGARDALVSIPLASITEIKKEASHFIFSSVTILEQGGTKHWFSALRPSRDTVFSVLEHFWREQLLARPGAAAKAAPATKGQELVGLMARSQQCLEHAARALHHQGQQLDGVAQGLDQMEANLDMADRLLTELEAPAWRPFGCRLWKTPADTKPQVGAAAVSPEAHRKAGVLLSIPAVVSRGAEAQVRLGQLMVLASGLEIHDSTFKLLHRFESSDVDDIQVHTPYEVTVRQRCLGKPDVSYRLLSARMPEAIRALGLQFSQKMELLGHATELWGPGGPSPREQGFSTHQAASRPQDSAWTPASREGGQLQLQAGEPPVSERDAQELSQITFAANAWMSPSQRPMWRRRAPGKNSELCR
ncbi:synaptosomal-associated protein 47 isoform X2 [Talpa occidentalis]|uniref:synaptosomal-associated protein 47 isoform X2 n=1 Tax=Talpa occidentalis TaxID=50954 RepID=UPI00188F17A1|nr:synaptosomal-associated protein 47 isoform X2 [Talpa occidentalis]